MPAGTWMWRRLVPGRLADAWVERVRWAAPGPPIVMEFPRRPTARVEVYGLSAGVARTLRRLYGGEIRVVRDAEWQAPMRRDFVRPVAGRMVLASESASLPARWRGLPVLRIPAGMAFGTGEHATTAMSLRQLAQEVIRRRKRNGLDGGPRVIDVGTGSGVLALAATLLGAKVEALDVDPVCVRECRANAARNPQVGRVRWVRADVLHYRPQARADVVVANLYADLLIQALPRMIRWLRPGGVMILSGILREQEQKVTEALARLRWHAARVLRKGKWVCLVVTPAA